MSLSVASMAVSDLLRLLAVPVFAWTALQDIRTRRVSSEIWIPLSTLGIALLVWDGWAAWSEGGTDWTQDFLLPVGISLGLVVPLAYLFWWFGGFGGADAKALLVLAVLFPTFPTYVVGSTTLPLTTTPTGTFSFTILTNAVVVGVAIPIVLAIRNGLARRFRPVMFVGWPISWDQVPETHGRLLQSSDGVSLGGLDLDALRMYLRWRGLTLETIRDSPDVYRDPTTLPADPNPPTDGAVTATGVGFDDGETLSDSGGPEGNGLDGDEPDGSGPDRDEADNEGIDGSSIGGSETDETEHTPSIHEDPWGGTTFLESIEGTAYGTSPEQLREGLDVLVEQERVWISPGTPFLVPLFVGLLIALVYGDLLLGILL